MDKNKKWPVSPELQDAAGTLSEASYADFEAWGYGVGPDSTVLVDDTDSQLVFLYRGVWRVVGTNGF